MVDLTILTGDFESYYTREYSLRNMTPAEYICHPLYELTGGAFRLDRVTLPMAPPLRDAQGQRTFSSKAKWVDGPDLPKLFAKIDWTKTAFMSHNVDFDGSILNWRYGIKPMLLIDTLGMSRALLPEAKGASLEKVLQHIGAPPKGTALAAALGYRLADLKNNPGFFQLYKAYCERDDDGCFWIFEELAHRMSGTAGVGTVHMNEEFLMMDMVARLSVVPQFRLNVPLLRSYHQRVIEDKEKLVASLKDSGILSDDHRGELLSNERFAQILRNLGVEPPTKISAKTGKETYAFAKTDSDFTDLIDHYDPHVQAVVAARLGHKSTLEETRTKRFIDIAEINWPAASGIEPRSMPFPLNYSAAHTHRLGGAWKLNLQNLGRKSTLREALVAPEGHVIVSADAAQIEARIVSWLAEALARVHNAGFSSKLVTAFRNKQDVYALLAADTYGYPIDKKTHPGERFVGKTGVLGLGFGMGAPKFQITCWVQGRNQGLAPELCQIDLALAEKTVKTYRGQNKEIPAYWKAQTEGIQALADKRSMDLGVLRFDGPSQTVILPNGMPLHYQNMRQEVVMGFNGQPRIQWVFDYGRIKKYTFGGKQTENAVQALARIITMNAATRIRRITKHRPLAGQIHDQLIYIVPASEGIHMRDIVLTEMARSLDWWHDLPLAAEGGIGDNLMDIRQIAAR